MRAVILQPLFFPWRGVFEQIRLAETYVHLDDVAPPQGRSFLSRVQIKTPTGAQWLTVPIRHGASRIQDILVDDSQPWRQTHLKTLKANYAKAPHFEVMWDLVQEVYAMPTDHLCEINIHSLERVSRALGLQCVFQRASAYASNRHGTDRLVELSEQVGATSYLTGHGALNYLNPEPFEDRGLSVEIMDYRRSPYPQLFENFDPHVSILDLIANTGTQASSFLDSSSAPWREYERDRKVSA